MKVLVACEHSGVVRDAFAARGHDAWSCDLLPTEAPGQHIQGDVLSVLEDGWDLIIAHPPCTHLARSGAQWFPEKIKDGRQEEGLQFALRFFNIRNCPRVAVENPVGVLGTLVRPYDQLIHPYMFGHPFQKQTCLWLFGLPKLRPTDIVSVPEENKLAFRDKWAGKDRWKQRSKTFPGIAAAMADQWGQTKVQKTGFGIKVPITKKRK